MFALRFTLFDWYSAKKNELRQKVEIVTGQIRLLIKSLRKSIMVLNKLKWVHWAVPLLGILYLFSQNLYAGQLNSEITYDDISYLRDFQNLTSTFHADGLITWLVSGLTDYPYSTILTMFGSLTWLLSDSNIEIFYFLWTVLLVLLFYYSLKFIKSTAIRSCLFLSFILAPGGIIVGGLIKGDFLFQVLSLLFVQEVLKREKSKPYLLIIYAFLLLFVKPGFLPLALYFVFGALFVFRQNILSGILNSIAKSKVIFTLSVLSFLSLCVIIFPRSIQRSIDLLYGVKSDWWVDDITTPSKMANEIFSLFGPFVIATSLTFFVYLLAARKQRIAINKVDFYISVIFFLGVVIGTWQNGVYQFPAAYLALASCFLLLHQFSGVSLKNEISFRLLQYAVLASVALCVSLFQQNTFPLWQDPIRTPPVNLNHRFLEGMQDKCILSSECQQMSQVFPVAATTVQWAVNSDTLNFYSIRDRMIISTQDFTTSQSVSDFELGLTTNKYFFVISADSSVGVNSRIGIAGDQDKVEDILQKFNFYIMDSFNGYKLWTRL